MMSGFNLGLIIFHITSYLVKFCSQFFREHNLATAKAVLEPLAEIFPDVQVVPSLGNHEPFPCNM